MIEVILLERIERLGQMGQTVKVRPGFARNFLLPQKKALRATKINLELFEKQREQLEAKNAGERAAAQTHATKIDGLTFVIIRQASETGQLYGSVSARDVSDAANDAGQKIARPQVVIDQPIKTIGLFPVKIRLHPEVTVKIMVNVARSPEEAVVQVDKHTAASKASADKAKVEAAFGAPVTEGEDTEETKAAKKPAKKAKAAKPAAEDEAEAEAEGDDEAKEAKPKAKKAAPKAKKSEK